MERTEKLRRLADMLGPIVEESHGGLESFGRTELEELDLPDTAQAEAGRRGAQKLSQGRVETIDDDELGGLEALVLPKLRPVAFIRDGVFDDIGNPWTHLNQEAPRKVLQPLFVSIGRIELPSTPWTYGGTGFVVGDDLVMTNRHVARQFTDGLGDRRLRFAAGEAAIDFKREKGLAATDLLSVREVVMIHPYWDMALLRVDGLLTRHPKLRLSTHEPETLIGREVVVVGYPARDDRNDLDLQDQLFQRTYDVKRVQPGKLRSREQIRSFGNDVLALPHDSSTLGGNSGSAVIDVATGDVVGLHFGGIYLKSNYGVPTYELARDARVVDKGVYFASAVAPTTDWSRAWEVADGAEANTPGAAPLNPASAPPVALQAQPGAPATLASPAASVVTFTIPIQVSISIGAVTSAQPQIAAPQPSAAVPPLERPMQVPIIHSFLSRRGGYKSGFLGGSVDVPLPELTTLGKKSVARLEDGSHELKYHRFSVVVHKGRRMAMFTAANVDWRPAKRLVDGKKPTRAQLTGIAAGAAEQWVTDPRIPDDCQLPDDFYTRDRAAFDKGHLVRRDDVCWGDSFEDIQKGNGDTYHTTNCSPQVGGFNRSANGEDNWGDLENLVQRQTKAERVIVFSGPVLRDDDPVFHGHDLRGEVEVQIPRAYWKIVVAASDGLRAYGFQLKQSLRDVKFTEEFVVPSEWDRYQVRIEDIEKALRGWARLDWLKEHDGFDTTEGRRMRV
jgi:endonuclease G, mitochondrial